MTDASVFSPRPSTPGLLFLCVANSARSQIAEGLARARFGDRVMVQSAGSRPETLNPHAAAVLGEIGIDSSGQRSKHVDTIEPASVTTVVTLCEEEVCPVFLSAAVRLAWPMRDPAGGAGSEAEQRERFRTTRREIARRLDGLVV